MKKQLFRYLIFEVVLLMLCPFCTKAQAIPHSHHDSLDYIFILRDTVINGTLMNVTYYKALLTARELGHTLPSDARLWRIPRILNNTVNGVTISYDFNDSIAAVGEIQRQVKAEGFGYNQQLLRAGLNQMQNDTIGFTRCQYVQEKMDFMLNVSPQRDSVKIGILDSGVHPQFEGSITNKWNFTTWNDNIDDDNGHGNFVANIIHKQLNNNNVKYSIFKVLKSNGSGYLFDIIRAIDNSIRLKLDVCNLSVSAIQATLIDTLRINDSILRITKAPLQIAMDSAAAHQVMLVIAAGNSVKDLDSVSNNTLATYTTASTIKVLGVNCNDSTAEYSNFGKKQVDIGAYSDSITSRDRNNQITMGKGTSFAAPKVTSAVAKLLFTMPPSTYQATDCKNALLRGRRYLPNLRDKCTSEGVINLNQAWRNLNLYALTLENPTCNNSDTLWLKLTMKTPRPCIDALTANIDFDTTQMRYIPNQIKKGNAIPNSSYIQDSYIAGQPIFITIDVDTSCVQGNSGAWLFRIPFLWNTNTVRRNITGKFQLTLKEERLSSRDTTHQSNHSYQVTSTNLISINVENNHSNIPLSIGLGNACNALSPSRNIIQNRYQVRRDSFSHFQINCTPINTIPLVRGYDVFMMYHKNTIGLTPMQRMAADVNYDNDIGNGDIITLMRRAILVYTNLHQYSGNRLTSDCLFVKDTNFTSVNRCYEIDTVSQATCDIATIPMKIIELGNVKNIDNPTFNNNISFYIDACKKVRVADEWKIPIYSNAISRSVDMHFRNITISPNLLRIESANPSIFRIESNGVGQSFYVIGYSNQYQGINATDTIAYLYVKTPNFYPQYLGSITSYQDTQQVNNQIRDICTNIKETNTINIDVFPNPCSEYLNISFTTPTTSLKEGKIYDLLGRCLQTFSIEPNIKNLTIDTKNISNGVFLLSVEGFKTKIIKY